MDFETIYCRYFRDVYLYIRSLTADDALAEEIAQETFYKAFKGINRFDGSEHIRAWIFAIARNTCFSFMKKQKRVTYGDIPESADETVSLEKSLMDKESIMEIHRFLHEMKEPYKEVFNLRVFGELPFENIGQIFGKSSGWARVTFYRAKGMILEYMEAMDHERNQL